MRNLFTYPSRSLRVKSDVVERALPRAEVIPKEAQYKTRAKLMAARLSVQQVATSKLHDQAVGVDVNLRQQSNKEGLEEQNEASECLTQP